MITRNLRVIVLIIIGTVALNRATTEFAIPFDWISFGVALGLAAIAVYITFRFNKWWAIIGRAREPRAGSVMSNHPENQLSARHDSSDLSKIFLSYAREDEHIVGALYEKLTAEGYKPWMDEKDIVAGEDWEQSIQKAIKQCEIFLACLSSNSINKRGFIQKEIRIALDIREKMLDTDIFMIPLRLEDCDVPDRLSGLQWVNYFEDDSWAKLLKAIRVGLERRQNKKS